MPDIALDRGNLDLWLLDEAEWMGRQSVLGRFLSEDEQARAGRFVRKQDQVRYTLFRGALRDILSRYQGTGDPARLSFVYNPAGKPALPGGNPVQFNLSHAGNRMALAVARCPVGVDIEVVDERTQVLELADRFFKPDEAWSLTQRSGRLQRRHFYRLWTAKEALLKAFGRGLGHLSSLPGLAEWGLMTEINREAFTGDVHQPRLTGVTTTEGQQGWLWAFPEMQGWVGTLAVTEPAHTIRLRSAAWWG